MAEQGLYRTWQRRLTTVPRLERFQQVGIGTSYPILIRAAAELQTRHFYHTSEQIGPDTIMIGPARVLVTLSYPAFDLVAVDFQAFDLPIFEDVAYTLTAAKRAARQPNVERLHALYDDLLAGSLTAPNDKPSGDLMGTLRQVVPPLLWPYYEVLLRDTVRVRL